MLGCIPVFAFDLYLTYFKVKVARIDGAAVIALAVAKLATLDVTRLARLDLLHPQGLT